MKKTAISYFISGTLVGIFLATVGFALVLRSADQAGTSDGGTVLKLAHSLDENHPVHRAMQRMSELLADKSAGAIDLQIFPNGQLGSETECIEQVQNGALDMTKCSIAPMESFVPQMSVFGLPYIFRNEQHCWNVLDGAIGRELLEAGADAGLRGLCFYDAGSRSFYTINRPVLSPSDLKGLKIRVQKSKTAMDMVEALGGSPTPIPWGELYTALQQKMVDGAENNLPSFYTTRHFEVCKHYSMDQHTRVPDILLMSERTWASLPIEAQRWVQEAAAESSQYQRELWKEAAAEALEAIQSAGVTVHYPDQSLFTEKVAGNFGSFPWSELVERIRAEGND